jgi:hypothetical protein
MSHESIRYLRQSEIDKEKWDHSIDIAENGLIYAYSFYLDTMAKHWDALVVGDYEIVFPLTWNEKYGMRYLSQPFLTAQLGIFGKNVTQADRDELINNIPTSFRYIDISLNSGNILSAPPIFSMQRSNFVLPLNNSYDKIVEQYNENLRRNLKKAAQAGCVIKKGLDVEEVIRLAIVQMKQHGNEPKNNVDRFRKLYRLLSDKKMAVSYGVADPQNNLLASAAFFILNDRAYYILVGNAASGREFGASHALIDAFIKDHADKLKWLDFEGSDIPSLASFYRSFGAEQEVYPALKINRLPFYLKWFKK